MQEIIIKELKIAEEKAKECNNEDGRELLDKVRCSCSFYRQYKLPCRYIWSNNKVFSCLRGEDFERYKLMWEDCDYETYQQQGVYC